ncbi:hypothetical protein V8E52_003697 [Russula decolorans]
MATSTSTSTDKLTIENTVEERILAFQKSKRALATAALTGDKIKNLKLGLEDLMALFRPGRTTTSFVLLGPYVVCTYN